MRRRHDDERPNANARGYDAAWERVRGRKLRRTPRCEVCGDVATEVDHKVRRRLFTEARAANDEVNLQSLCGPCHKAKTIAEDGGFGRRPVG